MDWFGFQAPRTLPSLFPAPFSCRRSTFRFIRAEKWDRAAAIVEPDFFAMEASVRLALYHGLALFLFSGFPAGVAELVVARFRRVGILAAVAGSGLVGHGAPLG